MLHSIWREGCSIQIDVHGGSSEQRNRLGTLRDSSHSCRGAEAFLLSTRAAVGLDLGTCGCDVDVPLIGRPPGAAYLSDYCRLREPRETVSEVAGESTDSRQTDGYHTFRHWSALLHGTRDASVSRKVVHCLLPSPRKKNRPCDIEDSSCFAKVKQPSATRRALCLEPVQAPVAPVSLSSQLARSHQRAMCLLPNLSTLPKYSQSWLQF